MRTAPSVSRRLSLSWYEELAFELSGLDRAKENQVTVPNIAIASCLYSDPEKASHKLQGTGTKFYSDVFVFLLGCYSTTVS